MRKSSARLLALLLALLLLVSMLPSAAFAAKKVKKEIEVSEFDRIPSDRPGISVEPEPANIKQDAELPAYYNSNDYGYITPARSQGTYGTCWTHSAIGACEANMIKKGLYVDGAPATAESLNLSEYHLTFFSLTKAYDALGMLTGDQTKSSANYLKSGGNGDYTSYTLMRWEGVASESVSQLQYTKANSLGLTAKYAYDYNVGHVQDCIWIPTRETSDVKQAILEYGAGSFAYYVATDRENYEGPAIGSYYFPVYESPNHEVTVVGWDDTYSRDNFSVTPEGDGAWIVKNSWGTTSGDQGYYYISYYDVPSYNDWCYFYNVEPTDNYDYNYQYDGTANAGSYMIIHGGGSAANIFTANGPEMLEAVAVCSNLDNLNYTLSIYTDVTDVPTSGKLATTQAGYLTYRGYQTIRLDEPVVLQEGQKFAVVFCEESLGAIATDKSGATLNKTFTHSAHENCSYFQEFGTTESWTAMPDENFRIKAYTSRINDQITVIADESMGTYTINGNIICVTPAEGYYLMRATLESGSGTCTVKDNNVYVDAEDACTVSLMFAEKKLWNISFQYNHVPISSMERYNDETYTICDGAGTEEDTFVGWVTTEVAKESNVEEIFLPGDQISAEDNVTYYALFSFAEESGGTAATYYTTDLDTAMPKCEHLNTEARDATAATCTAAGYTGDIYCADCGEKLADGNTIEAVGHDLHYTCSGSGHTVNCSRCDYTASEDHLMIDNACVYCNERFGILSAEMQLTENNKVIYTVHVPEGFENPYMVFNMLTASYTVKDYTVDENGDYCFVFSKIVPQYFAENIRATLYATCRGVKYTDTLSEFSVKGYCANLLEEHADNAELVAMISDYLSYGAYTQLYVKYRTDELATKGLALTPSTYPGLSKCKITYNGTKDATADWKSATLTVGNELSLRFTFTATSFEGLTIQCTMNGQTVTFDEDDFAATPRKTDSWYVDFSGIKPTEVDDWASVIFLRDGQQVGRTLNYSVSAYVCGVQDIASPQYLADMVKALYNYGQSAKAYKETIN